MILLKLPLKQIIANTYAGIYSRWIAIADLQSQSPTLLLRCDGMVDVIRNRPIHSSWKYLQTIQSRTIPANPCPVKTIFINSLFPHDDCITHMDCVRSNLEESDYRCRDKNSISLDNRLYLRLGTYFCRKRLERTEPSRHTSDC